MRIYRVTDWMSAPPILVQPATTLADAERIMGQHKLDLLPVVEDDHLVGIITWDDLVAVGLSAATSPSAHEWPALLDCVTVADRMMPDPVAIAPDATVFDAAQRMLDHKIGGLPVVDRGRVVGVITDSDLFRQLIANTTGADNRDRDAIVCGHCGAVLRGRYFASVGPDDVCWYCHFHLHRCDNCRYFDQSACLLNQVEHYEPVPGQHCPAFAYLPMRAASVGTNVSLMSHE